MISTTWDWIYIYIYIYVLIEYEAISYNNRKDSEVRIYQFIYIHIYIYSLSVSVTNNFIYTWDSRMKTYFSNSLPSLLFNLKIKSLLSFNNYNHNNGNDNGIPIVVGALGTIPKGLVKKNGRLGNKRKSKDHPDSSIIKIGQYTEKSLWDLMKFAVTQIPVRNHQLMLVWKTLKRKITKQIRFSDKNRLLNPSQKTRLSSKKKKSVVSTHGFCHFNRSQS